MLPDLKWHFLPNPISSIPTKRNKIYNNNNNKKVNKTKTRSSSVRAPSFIYKGVNNVWQIKSVLNWLDKGLIAYV